MRRMALLGQRQKFGLAEDRAVLADELGADVAKLTGDWEKIDKGNANHHTNTMKDIHAKIALLGAQLKLVVKIYDVILNDLLDNATYTPPPPEGKEWTRHVGVVTRRVKE